MISVGNHGLMIMEAFLSFQLIVLYYLAFTQKLLTLNSCNVHVVIESGSVNYQR